MILLTGALIHPLLGAAPVDFSREVRPILVDHCYQCHGPEKQKSGLRFDQKTRAFQGGDSGVVILPGRGTESLLVKLISGGDSDKVMPPKGERLTAREIQTVTAWIDQGAPWPDDAGTNATRAHWAFRKPVRPAPPRNTSAKNPIDDFILARLKQDKISPSPQAERTVLIRRLSFDLTGLPPTTDELNAFLTDKRPDAYDQLVDRLLASPHYGEQWARHWLDLARYADSDGYEKDGVRPYAYFYRDWVINALNDDLPFDKFSIEQLAGDLLPGGTLPQKIATGFHRNTLKNLEGGVDQEEFRCKAAVDRAATTGTVWLGLTVGCAECHSHKYDPISQREFYQFYAFFNNATDKDIPTPSQAELTRYEKERAKWSEMKESLTAEKAKESEPKYPPTKAQVLTENDPPRKTFVHIRGDFLRKGDEVEPGTFGCLHPFHSTGARPTRLDLARWLFDPENPLTGRVAVNRIWMHLFGRGLVSTVNDFGARGELPSHPELLDWLATEFPRLGWSQKKLIRLIVTSSTYRQASLNREDLQERDPINILLARQNRLRLEAENVRDTYLRAGGILAESIGGPSIRPPLPADIAAIGYANSIKWTESKGPDRFRRGLYIFFQRTIPYPMLMTFDSPDSNVTCTRRERSNTPLQALTSLNDPVFFECARALGREEAAMRGSLNQKLAGLFRICTSRDPSAPELKRLARLFADEKQLLTARPEAAKAVSGEGDDLDAAALIVVARTVLNLDETITRE